ncbi:MAG: hypothetical protein ACI8WY_002000 [Planctomycetota bacterium]
MPISYVDAKSRAALALQAVQSLEGKRGRQS